MVGSTDQLNIGPIQHLASEQEPQEPISSALTGAAAVLLGGFVTIWSVGLQIDACFSLNFPI